MNQNRPRQIIVKDSPSRPSQPVQRRGTTIDVRATKPRPPAAKAPVTKSVVSKVEHKVHHPQPLHHPKPATHDVPHVVQHIAPANKPVSRISWGKAVAAATFVTVVLAVVYFFL